jgi:hypothetical protein
MRFFFAAVVLALCVVVCGPAWSAPAPPPNPILSLLSPTATPVCADAVLATVVPGALGVKLPPAVGPLTAPVLIVCGGVPEPNHHLSCGPDQTVQDTLNKLLEMLAGIPQPLLLVPDQMIGGQLLALADVAPPLEPLIAPFVDGVLQCKTVTAPSTNLPPLPPAVPVAPLPSSSPTTPVTMPPSAPAPSAAPYVAPAVAPQTVVPPPSLPPAAIRRVVETTHPRFAYPIVMVIPLVLLALFAYLGRAVTTPVDTDDLE